MKNVKKIICCLLVAVMICVSPLASFVQIEQNVNRTEASEVLGGAALLELILAGFGVTVASSALNGATDDFSSWLDVNGQEESKATWNQALAAKTVTVGAKLVSDVGVWIGDKFASLESGSVSTVSNGLKYVDSVDDSVLKSVIDTYFLNTSYDPKHTIMRAGWNGATPNQVDFSVYPVSSVDLCVCVDGFCYFYSFDGADTLTSVSINRSSLYCYTSNISKTYSKGSGNYKYVAIPADGVFYCPLPIYYVPTNFNPSYSLSFDTVKSVSSSFVNTNVVDDAFTSYGGYRAGTVNDLDGLVVTAGTATAIMGGVAAAILANRINNDDGTVSWVDGVADSIADAYAQGIADAKVQAGTGSGTASDTSGWLSKILNAILAIPTLIFEAFKMTLTDGFSIVHDIFTSTTITQELITDIPSTLVGEFSEVFPTADSITQLITGIPASIVNALTEVFPVADSIQQLITWIPSALAEALGFGADVGTLSDALADIKAAVLAIPLSLADVIADAIAAIFVPDLALVEDEVAVIEDGLAWVPEVNDLVNDFKLRLKASEPPKLYLDFTKAEQSKYHDAGVCLAIDFSWYQRYKPTGDLVFGAFLWVIYIWYLFKRLPDILAGVGIITRQSINSDNRSNRQKGGNNE